MWGHPHLAKGLQPLRTPPHLAFETLGQKMKFSVFHLLPQLVVVISNNLISLWFGGVDKFEI
jgi:hypothetical protein